MGFLLPIGLGAGFISATLFVSITSGTPLSVLLFYLVLLPIFMAGFGWGVRAAGLAGLTATALIAAVGGAQFALSFAVTMAGPAFLLTRISCLHRDVESASTGHPARTQWYPLAGIIMWLAVMSGAISAITVLFFGPDLETYKNTITMFMEKAVFPQLRSANGVELTPDQLNSFSALAVNMFPGVYAVGWFVLTAFNMWLAMRIALISELFPRPTPNYSDIRYPPFFALILVGCIIAAWLPGISGLLFSAFAAAFLFAYLLAGMAILHSTIPRSPARPIILFVIYVALIFSGWVGLIIAIIGLSDHLFDWRGRFAAAQPGQTHNGQGDEE